MISQIFKNVTSSLNCLTLFLFFSISWLFSFPVSLFKRINWRKEKQKRGGRQQRQKRTAFEMLVSFVCVSSVTPGNTGWVCKWLRGRRKGKRAFYHSPQGAIHPSFSHREVVHLKECPWPCSGHGFAATSPQSQLSSLKGAAPFVPTIFPMPLFSQGWLLAREVTWSTSLCSFNNTWCKGGKGTEPTFLLAIQFFFWIKVPLCPQSQRKPRLQNQSFDVLQLEISFPTEIYLFF